MPRYGFDGQKTEMKIFILFIMRDVLDPVTLDQMGEMVLIDDNMDYFLYCECAAELVDAGLLIKEPGRQKGFDVYTLSPHGYNTLLPVERSLPVSLRRAGRERVQGVVARLRREARLRAEIIMRGEEPMARLTMTDGQDPILHIELVSGSRDRAHRICKKFMRDAESVFDGILDLLLEEESEG